MTVNVKSRQRRPSTPNPTAPDLQTQLEALLDMVWDSEANWRLDDRIDLALGAKRTPRS
jgi:hypothetical protein